MVVNLNIISLVKDDLHAIEKTILSVSKAVIPEGMKIRHLICIGNPSQFLLAGLRNLPFNNFEVVSTQDYGIYNAMNIGLSKVSSGWVMFLNGGDILHSHDSLCVIKNAIEESKSSLLQLQTKIGSKISPHKEYSRFELYLGRMMHAHPSFLFDFDRHPAIRFDERLLIVSDFKFVLEISRFDDISFKHEVVVDFEGGGISSRMLQTLVSESNLVREELCLNRLLLPFVRIWNLKVRLFSKL
jgi:hypothetical protein